MLSKRRYEGLWWIPDKPEEKINGVLSISFDEGVTLELKDKTIASYFLINHPILHGLSGSTVITLQNCTTYGIPGWSTNLQYGHYIFRAKYNIDSVFTDILVDSSDDLNFQRVFVRYSYLKEWSNISGLDKNIFFSESQPDFIKYSTSTPITLFQSQKFNIFLNIDHDLRYLDDNEYSIKEEHFILIEFMSLTNFEEIRIIIGTLGTFLAFCFSHPIKILSIKCEKSEKHNTEKDGNQWYPYSYVNSNMIYSWLYPYLPKKLPSGHKPLLILSDTNGQIERLLNKWFELTQSLSQILAIYSSITYIPFQYAEVKFLQVAQALEGYHRLKVNNQKDLSNEEHEQRVSIILSNILDTGHREWLENRLKYSNEPSLIKRLKELIRLCNPLFTLSSKNIDTMSKDISELRNNLTHINPPNSKNIERGTDWDKYYYAYEFSQILLKCCLLLAIGVDLKTVKIKNVLPRNPSEKLKDFLKII